MKKIARIVLLALSFCVLAVAVGLLTSSPAPAQAPAPSVPVTVVNTSGNPVQTTAVGTTTVAVRGTPTVNLASGTVMVGNSATSPVQVHNVNDATTPFEDRVVFNIDPGTQQNHASFNLPAGKRLVIEHISAYATGPSGQKFAAGFTTAVPSGGGLNWLVLELQGTFPLITGPTDVFTASQAMRVYTDSPPTLIVTRTDITGSATADATISGYLVNP
jgi:hypothetical protein